MARTTNKNSGDSAGGATVGYEAQPWQMADAPLAEKAQGADPEDPDEYRAQRSTADPNLGGVASPAVG